MANWTIKNVALRGVTGTVPSHSVKTSDFPFFTQKEADTFDATVGIKNRYIASDDTCSSDLCLDAAERLIDKLGWEKESIERWKEAHPDEDLVKNWSLSMDSLLDIDNVDDSLHALQLSEKAVEDIDSLSELVREKVMELSDLYQDLYQLYYLDGYSQSEIALMKNVSQYAISKRLTKLQHLLKDRILKNN